MAKEAPKAPAVIERLLKQLVVTIKAVNLYPATSTIPAENADEFVAILQTIFQGRPDVTFVISKDAVFYEGIPVFQNQSSFKSFARDLYNRRLAELRFHSGVDSRQVLGFLGVCLISPDELDESGGFDARLWDAGIDSITVTEASARIMDEGDEKADEPGDGEQWPPAPARVEEIIVAAYGARPREQMVLVRVMRDPEAVGAYLRASLGGEAGIGGEGGAGSRFIEMARLAGEQDGELKLELFRALADALSELDEASRRDFIADRLLPEARNDEALASVMRQMDLDEVCLLLAEGLSEDAISTDGLARAIRNLASISLADRDEVIDAAGAAMRSVGLDEPLVNDVVEAAAPSFLNVQEERAHATPVQQEEPDEVLKLLDMAPKRVAKEFEDDAGFLAAQDEAKLGLTDGDVVRTLVNIVQVDAAGDSFPSVMSLAEDSIEILIERGDFDVAADAAAGLKSAAQYEGLEADRATRIRAALLRLASVDQMRIVAKAMRMYQSDSQEYVACVRLLSTLGHEAVNPLLELLADEPDMSARKALIDLISEMAPAFITELSDKVSDGRWYVVRNVVMILGQTRESAVLPALGRTLRHHDPRVRRETIRALSGIRDRLAEEMLIAALADTDAQNVQLAARYLGTTGARGALPALQEVAKGEGRGNRDIGPRIEAIEALGRLGSADALPTLKHLSGKRSIMRGAKVKEIKAAADAAILAIDSGQGGALR